MAQTGKLGVEVPQNLVVVDAKNKVFGTLLGISPFDGQSLVVALRVLPQKRVVKLYITRNNYNNRDNIVVFTSRDCSGQPYITSYDMADDLFDPAFVGAPGSTLYVATLGHEPELRQTSSQLLWYSDPIYYPTGCIEDSYESNWTVPATPVVDLDTLFTLPFHLRHSGGK